MGAGKNKGLNSNLGLCMCIHEQNRKQQFVMVDPVESSDTDTLNKTVQLKLDQFKGNYRYN